MEEKQVSYEMYRDQAVQIYTVLRKKADICIVVGIIWTLLGVILTCIFLFPEMSIWFLLTSLFTLGGAWWLRDSIKKVQSLKREYKLRLERATETLTELGIFMSIPDEDYTRFDDWYQ